MSRVEHLASSLSAAFTRILHERMAGIPILNDRLEVEAVEFQLYEGRPFGVIITPWLMNLVMFPAEDEDWSAMKTGDVAAYEFPAGRREFQLNEIEGAGAVQSCSLVSPMSRFVNQDHARAAARHALAELMQAPDPEAHLDEQRLKQFIEEGSLPEDGAGAPETAETAPEGENPPAPGQAPQIARSDFLRGNFSGRS